MKNFNKLQSILDKSYYSSPLPFGNTLVISSLITLIKLKNIP